MKKKWLWLIGSIVFVGWVLVVVGLYWRMTRPNPHYVQGVKYLEGKEFESARDEFKLCLGKKRDRENARALILYCHLRELTEKENGTPAEVRERISNELERDLAVLVLGESRYLDLKPEEREKWRKDLKTGREYLRKYLREFDLYTSNWSESVALGQRTLGLVYKLKVDPDDEFDWFFHSICASLLAYQGDAKCGRDLIETAKQNPEACVFFHFAGEGIVPDLRAELANKESLLREKGMSELRKLVADQPINQFLGDHPGLRRVRKSDYKGKDRLYWDSTIESWMVATRDEFLKGRWYLKLDQKKKTSPFSFFEQTVSWDDNEEVMWMISGYDGTAQRFCGRIFLWDDAALSWLPLKVKVRGGAIGEEVGLPHSFMLSNEFDEEHKRASINIYRGETRQVTETETRTEQVTKYRESFDFFTGRTMVPYTTTEEVPHQVTKTRDVVVAERQYYRLNTETKTLEYVEKSEEVVYTSYN